MLEERMYLGYSLKNVKYRGIIRYGEVYFDHAQ